MPALDTTRSRVTDRFRQVVGDDVLSKRLEICLWNWTLKTCARDGIPLFWDNPRLRYRYTTRALGLAFNLRNPRNPELLRRVRSGELSVKTLANMTPQQMWPEMWEPVYHRVAMRQLRREADVDASKVPDGAFACSRCKSRKTVYTSMQIRSADEPMTNFVRCLNCGKSWKD
jgi:transcription elongation factor S-II